MKSTNTVTYMGDPRYFHEMEVNSVPTPKPRYLGGPEESRREAASCGIHTRHLVELVIDGKPYTVDGHELIAATQNALNLGQPAN